MNGALDAYGNYNPGVIASHATPEPNLHCNKEGTGSPVGTVVPDYIGQYFKNTSGPTYYRSTGTTSADWTQIGGSSPVSYKVYSALLTQSGTDAPVAVIQENTLGVVPVWAYADVGYYTLTFAGAFPNDKTLFFIQKKSHVTQTDFSVFFDSPPDTIAVETGRISAGVFQALDDRMNDPTPFEIRVYP